MTPDQAPATVDGHLPLLVYGAWNYRSPLKGASFVIPHSPFEREHD